MADYQLTEGDLREVDRVVAARAAHREIESQKATWSNAIVAEVEARERQAAIDAHARTEAARHALEPAPGSVEAVALAWKRGQKALWETAGNTAFMPKAFRDVEPAPKPIPPPFPPPEPDPNVPRPGSLEDIAARWKADQKSYGASGLYGR